ncbi:MAG: maleylpyruvate isomerase N-terminal domain-containing protein [Acidimicrobiales bacterium]
MRGAAISEAARSRTADIVSALEAIGSLSTPTRLPDWTRLTVACHLRYGAIASNKMTRDTLSGLEASFYPGGRSVQRPGTLVPDPGEDEQQVVASLGEEGAKLHDLWARLSESEWQTAAREPADNLDLGETTIVGLALLRLTEVEVHGSDLEVGLDDWSDVFVKSALPFRIGRLASPRSMRRAVESGVRGSWTLVGTDGPNWRISVSGDEVTIEPVDLPVRSDAVIEAMSRDLLAMLLGRPLRAGRIERGDTGLAREFSRAFPGP